MRGDSSVYYLEFVGGYTGAYIVQISLNSTLKISII